MIDKVEESRKLYSGTVKKTTGAMAIYSRISDPIAACETLGKFFHGSNMMGVKTPSNGAVLALSLMCEGIAPLEFSRTYHIVSGNVTMRADAMMAKFLARGGECKILQRTSECAEIYLKSDRGLEGTFSMTHEEARGESYYYEKDGKTPKNNWSTPRRVMQMLWARVISDGVGAVCPEVSTGMYTPEEVSDFDNSPVEIEYDSEPAPTPVTTTSSSDNREESNQVSQPVETPVEVPFEADQTEPCTNEQLEALLASGEKLGMDKAQVASAVIDAYKVTAPSGMTSDQARDAIEKMEKCFKEKSTSSQAA